MKENRTNVSLEARAREISDRLTQAYWEQTEKPMSDDALRKLYRESLLQFASEVADETRRETIRECADFSKEPCPYRPEPCGDCRHCHLTKAAIRILSLLPATPTHEERK